MCAVPCRASYLRVSWRQMNLRNPLRRVCRDIVKGSKSHAILYLPGLAGHKIRAGWVF